MRTRAQTKRGCLIEPPNAHPLVREFVGLLNASETNYADVEAISGISRDTQRKWGIRSNPVLPTFEAALNAIGYRLAIVTAPIPARRQREEART